MQDRRDASLGAAAFTLAARDLILRDFPDCVANVGRMDFTPGAFNIVSERVDVALEFRSPQAAQFARLDQAMIESAEEQADRYGLGLDQTDLGKHDPCPMDAGIQAAMAAASDGIGLSHISLASGAGHDGQSFGGVCPVGMLFVPSVDGASHSPREFTAWPDCVNGANALLQTVLRIAS